MVPCRVIQRRIWKNPDVTDERCRMCFQKPETVAHIFDGCTPLASKQYKERHDNMLRVFYYYLLKMCGFTEKEYPWYQKEHVEKVKENDKCIIYWDYEIRTVHYVKHTKPDIWVIFKKEDLIWVIEGSCPWDTNIQNKIAEKKNTYPPLIAELKNLFNKKKVLAVELVIGATGMIHKATAVSMGKILTREADLKRILGTCQKAVILGTVRIWRQILSADN